MKKFIVYVIFVFVAAISGYFIYGNMQSAKYDGRAVPYIEMVLPELSSWDAARVKLVLAPEILRTIPAGELEGLLHSLARLGELKSIGEKSFKNKATGANVKYVNFPVITYAIAAEYATGPATVTLSFLDRDGEYQLYSFNFQSLALAP